MSTLPGRFAATRGAGAGGGTGAAVGSGGNVHFVDVDLSVASVRDNPMKL